MEGDVDLSAPLVFHRQFLEHRGFDMFAGNCQQGRVQTHVSHFVRAPGRMQGRVERKAADKELAGMAAKGHRLYRENLTEKS
jgi:hypothetical protein